MDTPHIDNQRTPRPLPEELRSLLESNDGEAFENALEALLHSREQQLFRSLGHVARNLHESVKHLVQEVSGDEHQQSMADMRQRLQEVLDMSAQAAHRNLEMVETLRPRAAQLSAKADEAGTGELAEEAGAFARDCCTHFDELMVSQSWQDLSGQRVKQVVNFIGKVEDSLLELVRVTGTLAGNTAPAATAQAVERASTQDEVDRLLAEFGF
jgi:chemotaxis protein CheZ